jgi:YVTN family beta-propeller protein
MKRIRKKIFLVSIPVIIICLLVSSASAITRGQVKAIAEYYKNHTWTCISGNANPTYNDWVVGTTYEGVAYNWDGFDMVEEFKTKTNNGIVAGDSKVFGSVTCGRWFGGVDCSGFVSRCWELDQKHSTNSLVDISALIGWEDLKQGDITDNPGVHVRLFDSFAKGTNEMMMYEATTDGNYDKVVYRKLSRDNNYPPRRYNNIVDDYSPPSVSSKFNTGTHVVTTGDLNMRTGPGVAIETSCGWDSVITTLSPGAQGLVLNDPGNGKFSYGYHWWYVQFGGNIGWCSENRLALDNPPIVNTFNVNPSSVILGGSFTTSYTVIDDIGLRRVELWDSCASCTQWIQRDTYNIPGNPTSYSSSFTYAPSDTGTYFIGVHVVDNAEQCSHEPNPPGPAQRTVTPPVPSAPVLASPSNGLTGVPINPTLTWNASNWATSYRLQVSTSSTFTTTVVDQSGIMATSYPVSGLTSGTLYYWHVNASNVSGPSSWSDTWSFTTSAPTSPTIAYDPTSFSFTATQGGSNPSDQFLHISNSGGGTLNWTVSSNQTWLTLSPTNGTNADTITLSVNIAGLDTGNHSAQITISAPGATNSPQYASVTLRINPSEAPIVYITINPTSVNFGSVVIGQFADATITITNQSGSTGTLNGNVGSLSAPFSVIAGGGSFSMSPGQSRSVVVRFTPTSSDSLFASLSITHNATNQSSPTIVSLNGKGTEQPSGCQWQVAGTISLSGSQLLSYMATNNGKLYVGRYPNLLTVIDLSSNTTVANIPFGSFVYCTPGHIAVSGNRAYVALSNLGSDGQLAVVNTDDDSIVTYVPVGADPWGVATFGNRVYVTNNVWWANGDPATVLVIDKGTNMILDTIYVGKNPNCINVDPSSAKAYVTNGNSLSRSVSVINTGTNSVVATIQIPNGQPSGVAINNNCAYVPKIIDNMPGTVEVINTTSDSIVQSIPVGRDPIGVAVYNQYVFITNNSSNTVTIIDTASNTLVGTLNVGNHPFGIAVDPMSNKVYVGNQSDRTISIIDCPTSVETTTELVPKEYALRQNYPNPFNPETGIEFVLSKDCYVEISIYNLMGQKVRTLLSEYQTAGEKKTVWDGKDDRGNDLASGIYFYRLQAGDFSQTKKMVLLR